MHYVIGCDVGSQSLKAILVSTEGKICGESSASYPIEYPQPAWAQQSPNAWMDALAQAVRSLLIENNISSSQIVAVGLDAQVDGVVVTDSAGQPLYPAIIWMDRRAIAECKAAGKQISQQAVFKITGLNLDASHVAPKIRWLADHEPRLFAEAAQFMLPGSYVAFALTGEFGIDYSNASSTLLMDVQNREWSQQMCDIFEIPLHSLPSIFPATHVLGTLRPEAAERVGLTTSTKVILGSGDEHAACLGAGVIKAGLVCDIAGTAEPVCAASSELVFDPTHLVETHCHADPNLWLLENPGFVSGGNYRWLRDQFARGETYANLDHEAALIPPGAEGMTFLPSLMGAMTPTWNEAARGTFTGFTLAHTRGHFIRALLEGSAYAVRDITSQMQMTGMDLRELRVVGGGAKSRLWNQIKADVTGLQVNVPEITETTALGAAFLALVGIEAYATLLEASEHIVQIRERIDPDPVTQSIYADAYDRYRQTYFALLPVFEQAAGQSID